VINLSFTNEKEERNKNGNLPQTPETIL